MAIQHEYGEVAKFLKLKDLGSSIYEAAAIRLDGQGLAISGFEHAKHVTQSDYNGGVRVSRMGKYQNDHGTVLFCNERGEIWCLTTILSVPEGNAHLLQMHGYQEDTAQDPWVPGGIHAAYVNGYLTPEMEQVIYGAKTVREQPKPTQ